jgi:hypothetical protein
MSQIHWDPVDKRLEISAKGDSSSARFRTDAEKALQIIYDMRAEKLLSNLANIGSLSSEDLMWAATDFSTRLEKSTVAFSAIVVPKSLGLHMSFQKMTPAEGEIGSELTTRFFGDEHSARDWLKQQ